MSPEPIPLDVVYADDDVLVVNKVSADSFISWSLHVHHMFVVNCQGM